MIDMIRVKWRLLTALEKNDSTYSEDCPACGSVSYPTYIYGKKFQGCRSCFTEEASE